MTLRWLPQMIPWAMAAAVVSALAQTAAPAPGVPASTPLMLSKPGPRLQTPTELRESASSPGELRPDERVTPQIIIPLRKTAAPTKAQRAVGRRGSAASSAGVDDSAARCEAQSSKAARDQCRDSLGPKGARR